MKIITPNWPAPPNIHAMVTTRDTDLTTLNLPNEPCWLEQIHGTTVIKADKLNGKMAADASYTDKAKTICVVRTADCLPLLLCNRQGTKVAAIHAGWRGLANGIIEKVIDRLKTHQKPLQTSPCQGRLKKSAPPDKGELEGVGELIAWLGPAISANAFEVGNDVYQAFSDKSCFTKKSVTKWNLDLYKAAKNILSKYGITNVYGGDFCTYTDHRRFFSYRREGVKAGRMASLIWLT